MSDWKSLSSFCRHLERHSHKYTSGNEISRLFQAIRDLDIERGSVQQAKKAEWESEFFSVHFEKGHVKYAQYESYSEAKYEYLISRLKSTKNAVLKARYSHILWGSPTHKHSSYGKSAVDSYLELVRTYERQHIETPASWYGHQLLSALLNGVSLAYQTRHRVKETKSEVRRILHEFPHENPASIYIRRALTRYMLDEKSKDPRA